MTKYVDVVTNEIHFYECPKVVKKGRLKIVPTKTREYTPCPWCQNMKYIYEHDKEAYDAEMAKYPEFKFHVGKDWLRIQTGKSFWKLGWNCNFYCLRLYHGNKESFDPENPYKHNYKHSEYHVQNDAKDYKTFGQMLAYIQTHDEFRHDHKLTSVRAMPGCNRAQRRRRNRYKKSVDRYRLKHTLELIESLHKEPSSDNLESK